MGGGGCAWRGGVGLVVLLRSDLGWQRVGGGGGGGGDGCS